MEDASNYLFGTTQYDLQLLNLKQLIELAEFLSLDTTGANTKAELISIIKSKTVTEDANDDDADEDEEDDDSSELPSITQPNPVISQQKRSATVSITRDLEHSQPTNPLSKSASSSSLGSGGSWKGPVRKIGSSSLLDGTIRRDPQPNSPTFNLKFRINATVPVNSSVEKVFMAYVVEVDDNGQRKTLLKRYSQLHDLHEQIKRDYPKKDIPKFPSKKFIGNMNPEFVEKRCKKLEIYLNKSAQLAGIFDKDYMKNFIELAALPPKQPSREHSRTFSFLKSKTLKREFTFDRMKKSQTNHLLEKELQDDDKHKLVEGIDHELQSKIREVDEHPTRAHLNNCDLIKIPNSIYGKTWISQIKLLDLSGNYLNSFPDLSKLTSLEFLYLSDNKISSIPTLPEPFTPLKELQLNQNAITRLNASISMFVNLEKLDIKNNNLKDISGIGTLTNLTILNLSGNPIGKLPGNLCSCDRLEILDLSSCNLIYFPDALTDLTSLIELNLAHNILQELPEDIGSLTKLTKLNVSYNLMEEIPISIGACKALENGGLLVEGNPLNDLEIASNSKDPVQLFKCLEKRWKDQRSITTTNDKNRSSQRVSWRLSISQMAYRNFSNFLQTTGSQSTNEKITFITKWAITEIESELLPKLSEIDDHVKDATSLSSAKQRGEIVRKMKTALDESSSKSVWNNVRKAIETLDLKPLPNPVVTDDKLLSLKEIIKVVLRDLQMSLTGVKLTLEKPCQPHDVIHLVKLIKEIKQAIDSNPIQ